jgi:NTE family protein
MPVFGLPAEGSPGLRSEGGVDGGRLAPQHGRLALPDGRNADTVFVLGGGANRGALQVGMLRALVERNISPDLLVGTSIGAINAVAFAGQASIEGVYLAADIWRRIVVSDVFPRSRFHGTWRFFERREAIYPNDGLRRVVERGIRFEMLEQTPIPVVVVATRLEDGAETWLSSGPAVTSVMASAALPGLYPAVELDGCHYIDGGVVNNVPISVALAARPRRVFVLLCSGLDTAVPAYDRPYEALLAAFNLNLRARLRRDLAATPPNVDVIVLDDPSMAHVDMEDLSRTNEMIELGYHSARQTLDEYQAAVAGRSEVAEAAARLRRASRDELTALFGRRARERGTPSDH